MRCVAPGLYPVIVGSTPTLRIKKHEGSERDSIRNPEYQTQTIRKYDR